ncbi:MAG TPA: spore coat U domain-containing protein [Geminicoccaceae bacterium]
MRVTPGAWAVLAVLLGPGLLGLGPLRAAECDVSVSFIDFGRVDPEDGGEVTGEVAVLCEGPTRFRLALSPGMGDFQERRMRGPDGRSLRYNIYLDPARRTVWGDGLTAGTGRLVGRNDGRRHTILAVYGRVARGQRMVAGQYADSLVVAVEP